MARKRPRAELDFGSGGLYDFLPQAAASEGVAPTKVETPMPEEDRSRVIFLDIDGVLLPEGETQRVLVDGELVPVLPNTEDCNFNKTALDALRTVFQHTGASIVLTSEWRRSEVMRNCVGMGLRTRGLPQIRGWTTTTVKARPELVSANTSVAFAERRAREISEWLQRHPDVRAWVAIDDVDLSWGDGAGAKNTVLMRSRVVRTNAKTCLSEQNAQEAIRILCNPRRMTAEEEAGAQRRAARKFQAAFPAVKSTEKVAEKKSNEADGLPKPVPLRQGF